MRKDFETLTHRALSELIKKHNPCRIEIFWNKSGYRHGDDEQIGKKGWGIWAMEDIPMGPDDGPWLFAHDGEEFLSTCIMELVRFLNEAEGNQ